MNFKAGDIILCIDDDHYGLSLNKKYTVIRTHSDVTVLILNDLGNEQVNYTHRFVNVKIKQFNDEMKEIIEDANS